MPRLVPYPWAARALAILLLSAALLKVHGLRVAPVGPIGTFFAPAIQIAVIEVEVCLALWLFLGMRRQGAWIAAVAVFAVFAGASGYQGWIGQSSCGCFGKLSVNPWYTFGGDLGIVALLLVARPLAEVPGETDVVGRTLAFARPDLRGFRRQELLRALFPAVAGLSAALVLLGVLSGAASWAFGSADAAIEFLRGERLVVAPPLVDLGTGLPGEIREAELAVINRTYHPIRVIGGTKD